MTIRDDISKNRTVLMGIAMMSIILFHHGWTVVPGITALFSRFGLWGVDLFLFLSGFGCVYALEKYSTHMTFYVRRLKRIFPTCVLIGVLIFLIDLYFDAERTKVPLIYRLMSLHRWYIQAILICYLIAPLVYNLISKTRFYGVVGFIILCLLLKKLFVGIDTGGFRIIWILDRIPVFLIGMYVAKFDLKISKIMWVVSGCMFVLAMCIRVRLLDSPFVDWTLFLAIALPGVCFLLCQLKPLLDKLHLQRLFEILGLYSLEIYLIHEYFYWALYPLDFPLWIRYLLFFAIVPILCFCVKVIGDFIIRALSYQRHSI